MPYRDEWFDKLYLENTPQMFKKAYYLLRNEQIAKELVNQAFLIYLYKRRDLEDHPNLTGWLNQTLKNLILDEIKSSRHRLEIPLNPNIEIPVDDTYCPPLSEVLPKGLTLKEREILILFYEKQLSYEEIAEQMNISVLNCRTRLFRARARYKTLLENE
ncbi:MAG: RNA polymerase sigma factor [Syntrophomonadaceae bacterium]|nr:RNA polymerase sigma factor [Syntrophomonadaceae bacterium]